MADKAHFVLVDDWEAAESRLAFIALKPRSAPSSFRIHMRDHRLREVGPSLETHHDNFVLSQASRDPSDALRLAQQTYGPEARAVDIGGRQGWAYELGPEPEEADHDPRQPSVVTWADSGLFVFLASDVLEVDLLLKEARSLYRGGDSRVR